MTLWRQVLAALSDDTLDDATREAIVAPAVPPSSPSAVRPRASIRALAEETSRSNGGVHRLLDGAGTTFRSRSGVPRRPES